MEGNTDTAPLKTGWQELTPLLVLFQISKQQESGQVHKFYSNIQSVSFCASVLRELVWYNIVLCDI